MHIVIKLRIDTVSGQHGKAYVLNSGAELFNKNGFVGRVAVQEATEVERGDDVIVIEFIASLIALIFLTDREDQYIAMKVLRTICSICPQSLRSERSSCVRASSGERVV
ncbi:MAG: hypothetical protein IIB77_03935 [Proteobacteria bacterium]|nr:hypothetical protein [Pseudomonadota bacterium]